MRSTLRLLGDGYVASRVAVDFDATPTWGMFSTNGAGEDQVNPARRLRPKGGRAAKALLKFCG